MRAILFSIIALFAVFAIGGVNPVQAAAANTVCKGLATDACSSSAGCSWVKPYKTKKGKEISGFCRKKAGAKPKPAKSAS
jgi:hypothetical protein